MLFLRKSPIITTKNRFLRADYVGYLVTDNQTWFFANHIEINKKSDLEFRKKLTMTTFKVLNIVQ